MINIFLREVEKVGYGNSVAVYKLPDKDESETRRVVRVPHDLQKDKEEIRHLGELINYIGDSFLPNPQQEEFLIDGVKREIVTCNEVSTKYNSTRPSLENFIRHLDKLPSLDDKLDYLTQLRKFVISCKFFFWETGSLPDLIGMGNIVPYDNGIMLLDFNNVSFEHELSDIGDGIKIPLDDNGNPIFDRSLHLLYQIEKYLLSYSQNNFSTQSFTRYYAKTHNLKPDAILLLKEYICVPRDNLKKDPFYGALRFKKRREAVRRIIGQLDHVHI